MVTGDITNFRLKGENLGYEMCQSRNSWDDAEYKGINTRWVTEGGQRFEVQFHTPERASTPSNTSPTALTSGPAIH